MFQLRTGVFETNSSSTHSIAIPKNITETLPSSIYFDVGEYGWENAEYDNPGNYLYTALCGLYNRYDLSTNTYTLDPEFYAKLEHIKDVLNSHGVECEFAMGMSPKEFNEKKFEEGYIDHVDYTKEFVNDLFSDDELLFRYLIGGIIYTGNDNSSADNDWCNCYYDDCSYHDSENYDYRYKGN